MKTIQCESCGYPNRFGDGDCEDATLRQVLTAYEKALRHLRGNKSPLSNLAKKMVREAFDAALAEIPK